MCYIGLSEKEKSAMKMNTELFKNPTNEYRGKPFWSINGKLEKDELLYQIDVFRKMGMGGYFFHSRTGLETEYLGKEWFDLINICADKSEKDGMETWLYDEDRWPSGASGGLVTKDPQYAMRYLRLNIVPSDEFEWCDGIISAFSVKLDGRTFWDKQRLTPGTTPRNDTVLFFTVELMAPDGYCNNQPYLNTLDIKATEKFIEITHERYKEHCKERLGRSIKGIFTDEPHRGGVMCNFNINNIDANNITPYTEKLFPEIYERYHIDMEEYLPELFLFKKGEKISRVKWVYMETLTSMFIENFVKPLYDWCEENGLILTGHFLHEDTLTAQASMMGSLMRGYEYMQYPGIDVLGQQNRIYWAVKQVYSVARQLGKEKVLSELYGCTGWHMNFQEYKEGGDWQALLGINIRCHHLSYYTMAGENKRDFPASILHQSDWYRNFRYVEDYFSRIHVFLDCEDICDVLVVSPIESVWCRIHPGWSRSLEATDDETKQIEKNFTDTFFALIGNHVEFDCGDEDLISRYYSIEKTNEGTYLRIGRVRYQTVIVSGLVTIRGTTLRILREFSNSGGKVIFANGVPQFVDAQDEYGAPDFDCLTCDIEHVADLLDESKHVRIIEKDTGKTCQKVFTKIKQYGDKVRLMLLNTDRFEGAENLEVTVYFEGGLSCYDARTGEIATVEAQSENGRTVFTLSLTPSEERLYEIDPSGRQTGVSAFTSVKEIPIDGAFPYTLNEKNLLALDMPEYKIGDGEYETPDEILKVDRKIRDFYGMEYRGGEKLQPWYKKNFELKKYGKITLRYTFNVDFVPDSLYLIMEQAGEFDKFLNGNRIENTDSGERWTDICYHVIPLDAEMIRKGTNELLLQVSEFHDNINLEAVYLYGNFAVDLKGTRQTIIPLPDKLKLADIVGQGLPFYGAGITYTIDNVPEIAESQCLFVELDDMEAAYLAVSNGESTKTIAFKPFRCDITDLVKKGNADPLYFEVVFNRRNVFGPLHMLPKKPLAMGPFDFVTEGERFVRDGYSLVNQGEIKGLRFVIQQAL